MLTSPTTSSWIRPSPIETLVTRACEPSLHEPNYAQHLEVAEYINQKKANNPREAAMLIARLANHRNPHIAILALALLDTLVKSCGYPFHLQIATKEFLNELVRRFPERPPPFPGPVMSRILELIHTWKEGICTESRWREDLGNIRDMHRLLTFKGYRFREIRQQQRDVVDAAANLKSAEELEEEDRAAQSAKLQELIRRGTPRDLAAAQELMKVLAGANPDAKPDYRTQALTELNKLEQKVILLNEMLDNVDTAKGERFASGDAYDQVSSILSAARPKIQKWISDAQEDDPESLDTFLQINDQINTVIARYDAYKKGDYTFAANPIPAEVSAAAGADSLIDFDFDAPTTNTTQAPTSGPADLAGLFASPAPPALTNPGNQNIFGMLGQQPLMQHPQASAPTPFNGAGSGMVWGSQATGSIPGVSNTPPAAIRLGTPSGTPGSSIINHSTGGSPAPNYFNPNNGAAPRGPVQMGGMGGNLGGLTLGATIAQNSGIMQPQKQATPAAPPAASTTSQTQTQQGKDPFADLAGLF